MAYTELLETYFDPYQRIDDRFVMNINDFLSTPIPGVETTVTHSGILVVGWSVVALVILPRLEQLGR